MRYRKLRGKIRENDYDQSDVAAQLGVCSMAVSNRFTGKTDWKLGEAYKILKWLDIAPEKLSEYFPAGGKTE